MIQIGAIQFSDAHVRHYRRIQQELEKQAAPRAEAAVEEAAKGAGGKFKVPGRVGEWLLGGLVLAGAGAAMGLGASGVAAGAGKVSDLMHAATFNKQFEATLKADPTLKENKEKSKQYFGILHRASPYLAGEPILAAATVKGMIEYEHAPGDQRIRSILDTESAYESARHPFLSRKLPSMPTGMANVGDRIGG